MTIESEKGLARVKEICRSRSGRARELKAEGKMVFGYLCIYPVLELMTASDIVPYRILGDTVEPVTEADDYMPSIVCPFLRSILDLGLKGRYDFLDGVVMAHICDVGARTANLWDVAVKTPFSHFIDIPHTNRETSRMRLVELLADFQRDLESFTGLEISGIKLKESIRKHNEQRALVRELYSLKKPDPPLVSGTETLQVMTALASLPVDEGNSLLKEVMAEIRERRNTLPEKSARLLVWGSIIDDSALIEMMESLDASVVMDDTCVGSRGYFADIPLTENPLDGLAYHYLENIKCPRTFRDSIKKGAGPGYRGDLETRFGYLGSLVKDWNVNGVVLQALRYCDSHGYEIPQLKDYLDGIGLPNIYIEHDYSRAAFGQLMTRIQAFTEIIG